MKKMENAHICVAMYISKGKKIICFYSMMLSIVFFFYFINFINCIILSAGMKPCPQIKYGGHT